MDIVLFVLLATIALLAASRRLRCTIGWHTPGMVSGYITVGAWPELELDVVCTACYRLLDRRILTKADHQHALQRFNDRHAGHGEYS